jgi:choline dehydrogenase
MIRPNATVDCLLFDERRVVGVRLVSGEKVLARQCVLAAGSIGSAAILLRSDIGPADDLTALASRPSSIGRE